MARSTKNSIKYNAPAVSRRAVLRGAGVVVALPWLESFSAAGATTNSPAVFPKRLGILFMGCGINENHWSVEAQGADMKFSKTLSVLDPIKQKVNVIDGLFLDSAINLGIHPPMTGGLLSGAHLTSGATIHSGVSIDQMIANTVGQDTAQPSISLACEEPATGFHETNYSLAYSSHISWRRTDSPVPVEVYPSLAFDSLFENGGNLRNISVLDRVKDRAEALSRKISSKDKEKLDEYLTGVREVEQRVESMRKTKDQSDELAKQKNKPAFTMERPQNGLPEDLRDHARLMCDIIAMAFQTDRTRVASLITARDLSSLYYPFLQVTIGHHGASHDNLSDGYERIASFHLSQLTYLASKLDSMPEGDGTVLDHSCLMWLSNMFVGRLHDNTRLPLVLAGGLGGTLKTGRALNYLKEDDENRKMCSLYLSIMDRMGVKLDRFGDATERLQRL
jgi:Protein of unknown function (DUF1552)